MQKEWLSKVWGYAKATGIPEARAIQLSVLIWVNRDISSIEDFDSSKYADFSAILAGSSPWKGRWVKSESKKHTQGVVRDESEPTCMNFEEFWTLYQYKTGRPGSAQIWAKLDEAKRERIKAHLPGYIASTVNNKAHPGKELYKAFRAMPQSYLNDKNCKYWKDEIVEQGPVVEVDQKNLDGLFAKLNISLGYQLVPDKQALSLSLEYFKSSVEEFDERKFVNSIQDYYDEKGSFGGKLANALRSQDLRNYYLSRFKK